MASLKTILKLVLITSGVFMVHGVSISSVAVTNTDAVPIVPVSATKSLSMINIPQVPEFPKLAARPGKNPGVSSPAISSNSKDKDQASSQQPHHQQQSHQHQQQPQQSSHSAQQPIQPTVQNLISPFGLPLAFPSLPNAGGQQLLQQLQQQQQQDPEPVPYESISTEQVSPPEESHRDEEEEEEEEDYSNDNSYNESSHELETETTFQYDPAMVTSSVTTKNESSSNKHADVIQPEKHQDSPADFPMPMHVMNILNALGSGGSLAQATKPEKDGVGQGYTTANAIGYATGDNATVTASVSNKMELNTQTVILTESASASASSMSNGTAFSQATLASNGYSSQFGPGGTGWKASNKNPVMLYN